MRPKLLSLLTASALALVGCSSSEPTETVAVTPSESPVGKVSAELELSDEPPTTYSQDLGLAPEEFGFAVYADNQARFNTYSGPQDRISIKDSVEALREYCDHDEPFDLHDDQKLNQSMEKMVKDADTCAKIEQ